MNLREMRILWFTNDLLPEIAKKNEIRASVNEGWLVGMADALKECCEHLELGIVCSQNFVNKDIQGELEKYRYYTYFEKSKDIYNEKIEQKICHIIKDFAPDVIHIMGTEYPHAYAIVNACEKCNMLEHTLISIQGLVSTCAIHYGNFVYKNRQIKKTFRDWIKGDGLKSTLCKLQNRGYYEMLALKKCKHIIGRTRFDRGCTKMLNKNRIYHLNNEVLRPEFYTGSWKHNACELHTIFFSQVTNPLKGFHIMLQALHEVKKEFPDVLLYVAGSDVLIKQKNIPAWRKTSYIRYLDMLIDKYDLENSIVFCGTLDSNGMRERYLKSNVFVSTSLIENSPNSVGEAMLLGVPTISVATGGVEDMLVHGLEGFVYNESEVYMLVYYIATLFKNRDLCEHFSVNARNHALTTHSREINTDALLNIYTEVGER